jgi:ABC-type glycerol-3-phosphate transport system permease component
MISETLILFVFIAMWLVTFILTFVLNNKFVPGIGGVIGMFLGIRMVGDVDRMLGVIVMFVALFQLYWAAFEVEKRK